jgi:spermidine/putrescine transport system permease protein
MPRFSRWLVVPLLGVYGFLYVPIVILAVLSFNESGLPTAWTGFSTKWYGALFSNDLILRGARTTLVVALGATVLATIIGTLLALGLERYSRSVLFDAFAIAPAVVPDIVLAIGLLAFYTMIQFTLGTVSVLFAHVTFNIAFVTAVVRTRLHNFDRQLEEASLDLGATELRTFFRVTLPLIAPGILAAALLSFTLSVDEFVIAFFTRGAGVETLPTVIYSMVRFGITPEINALAVVLLGLSFTIVVVSQRLIGLRRVVENA